MENIGAQENQAKTFTKRYRFGFNGQERDNEVYGEGNAYTAQFWEYDPRLGRRFNIDPVLDVSISSYATFKNNPIFLNDPNGDDLTPDELKSRKVFTDSRKERRSVNKYEKKFNRLIAKGVNPNDAHQQLQEKYKNRKWMWVKSQKDSDNSGTSHTAYFNAADLYKYYSGTDAERNGTTITLPLNETNRGDVDPATGLPSTSFTIPSDGFANVTLNAPSGTFNYTVSQSATPGSTVGATTLANVTVPAAPGAPASVPLGFNLRVSDGSSLVITFASTATRSTGSIVSNATITVPVAPTVLPRSYSPVVGSGRSSLNRATIRQLNAFRETGNGTIVRP